MEANIRQKQENHETAYLSPFAAKSRDASRETAEDECVVRTAFQRDRDRIIHTKSFRRLARKTQMFVNPDSDHYRTRLTHTLETSQIARTIAGALRLNTDLVEAIALGHDLGHTPFGHIGEGALNRLAKNGFEHNKQSVRTVKSIENNGNGLNLTIETLDGIENHSSRNMPKTLEGKIVRLSDKIAYVSHDIEDAVRAGLIAENDLPKDAVNLLGSTSRERINNVILSILKASEGKNDILMEEETAEKFWNLRAFMFDNVYLNRSDAETNRLENVIERIFVYYSRFPAKMPAFFAGEAQNDPETAVCDYIAGMTDNFAFAECERIGDE